MSKVTILVLSLCVALAAIIGLLCGLVREGRKLETLLVHVNARDSRYTDFIVYRAYRDAELDVVRQVVTFPSSNIWEQSLEAGSLKIKLDPGGPSSQNAIAEFGPIYNWHKSRAAFRRLQQTSPSIATQFLDTVERAGILTHQERVGVEGTNVFDPY